MNGLEDAPYSVLLLDTEPRTHNHYIALAIADALRRHPDVARVRLARHGDAIASFVSGGFDTVLAFGGARTHTPLLARLAALSRLSILWTTEDPYERSANVLCSTAFDLVFTNDRGSVEAYGGRARHLPLAAASLFQDLDVVGQDQGYLYDLLFVGTAWPNRVESLNAILRRLPSDLKVKLALPWNVHIGPPALEDESPVTDWRCGNRDFARLANRSRVVLTLPRVFSSASADQAAGTTPPPRLFEAALAGGFQVVVSPEPEWRDYYEPDSEIALCADDREAAETIAALLRSPGRRIAAARAARARTRREHLYDHRVATILAAASEHRRPVPTQRRRQRTILMLTHNRKGYRGAGGVEIYQEMLTGIGEDYRVLFLFPVLGEGRWDLRLEGPGIRETFDGGATGLPLLTHTAIEGLFERILFEHRVDLLHVHHLLHLPLSLPLVARACGVPVVYHLHDHHLICERWLLLDRAGRFCDVVHRGSGQCDACLSASANYPPGAKTRRDGFTAHVVRAVDAFVTSTPSTGAYLRAFFPEIEPERIVEIEMALPGPASTPLHRARADASAPLTVAILGNFTHHKGGDDIIELIRTCANHPIHFKVFGVADPHQRDRLAGVPRDRLTVVGGYERHAIVALLEGCDVSLHLSIWPETFVIALTEAWQAGLVPIVTDLGALGERVHDGVDGFTVPPHDPGAVRARLLDLHADRDRLARMRGAVARKRFVAAETHLEAMRALYDELIALRPCPHDRVPDRLRESFYLSAADLGIRVNAPSWASGDILWDAAVESAPLPDIRLTEALPSPYRDLPMTVDPFMQGRFAWFLDSLRIDDRDVARSDGHAAARRTLAIRGWLHDRDGPSPERTYLRFTDGTGTAYAELHADPRPDVAESLGDPSAAGAGFVGRIDLTGLSFGPMTVDALHAGPGALAAAPGLFRVFAAPGVGAPARFEPDRDAVPLVAGRLAAIRQNLPDADGGLLANPGDVWAFEARIEDCAKPSEGEACAWLRTAGGTSWRVCAEDHGGGTIRFAASLSDLEPGTYTLGLGFRSARAAWAVEAPGWVWIVPDGQRFRNDTTPPRGVLGRFPKRTDRTLVLDSVLRETSDGRPAGGTVRCKGWAYHRRLGPPLFAVAVWRARNLTQTCIAIGLARSDVVAHLAEPSALTAGFDLAIPESVLSGGRVRLFQRYTRRTVEFVAFDAALRRGLADGQ